MTYATRKPRGSKLKPHEMQILTGQPQDGVNKWAWNQLSEPSRPDEIANVDDLLTRGAAVVPEARIDELRAWLDECRNSDNDQCPLPPMSAAFCEASEAASRAQFEASPGMRELGGSWRDYYRFHPVSAAV